MDYTKLWKLLIDKGISRTELLELTGMSSRVLAKLSKNQTVTTDTLARICEALDCEVGDIMECRNDESLSFYAYVQRYGKTVGEDDLFKILSVEKDGAHYTVYVTKKAAGKATQIHCKEDGTIYREQLYPLGGGFSTPARDESVLLKPKRERGETVIVVISGKPAIITGLDENGFVSARGKVRSDTDVYVMSAAVFKLFVPKTH